jgi:hypothetical protein
MKNFRVVRLSLVVIGCMSALSIQASSGLSEINTAATAPVEQTKREAARTVARAVADPVFASSLIDELHQTQNRQEKSASLQRVLNRYQKATASTIPTPDDAQRNHPQNAQQGAAKTLRQLDNTLLAYKGIEGFSAGLLQVRLYQPMGQSVAPAEFTRLLVAFEPSGDDKQWRVAQAYDSQGNVFHLDARQPPSFPVLIVGVDGREDVRAGVAIANRLLAARGLQAAVRARAQSSAASVQPDDGIDTTKLDRISLKDDNEPWIAGAAEVYALVSGLQQTEAKAQIELVDMPYLEKDNVTYTPDQLLVYWNNYRYGAATIHFYEHDDNTSYKDLIVKLATGVESAVGAFKPDYAIIGIIGRSILQAMPNDWFSNSDDYIDSFYTVEKGHRYIDHVGAANNATITLTPYRVKGGQ